MTLLEIDVLVCAVFDGMCSIEDPSEYIFESMDLVVAFRIGDLCVIAIDSFISRRYGCLSPSIIVYTHANLFYVCFVLYMSLNR